MEHCKLSWGMPVDHRDAKPTVTMHSTSKHPTKKLQQSRLKSLAWILRQHGVHFDSAYLLAELRLAVGASLLFVQLL